MVSERLAGDGEAAHVGPALAVRDAIFEEAPRAELAHQRAALVVEVFGIAAGQIVGAPILEVVRQLPVPRLEKGPGEEAAIAHQSP